MCTLWALEARAFLGTALGMGYRDDGLNVHERSMASFFAKKVGRAAMHIYFGSIYLYC